MTVPNEPAVLIIDALPLRSLGFISALNCLTQLGDPTKNPVTLHTPDKSGPWIDAHANCEMLIYRLHPRPVLCPERGQRRCKKFRRRSEKSQSNSEAEGGPGTPEQRRHEQGYCAPAGDEGRYGQSSCPADHAQVRRDEPHAGRCCMRERPARPWPKGGVISPIGANARACSHRRLQPRLGLGHIAAPSSA
jgi:hypothetical protein